MLTKPSKGLKNDGYDNEDSDYILYVNDILGSEEAGHKNRYLILDVLGQGTFGQVVKCQNMKTQEVVAVKVIKNRTAYFNQSMMEVSVLDLVSHAPLPPFPAHANRPASLIPSWTRTTTTTSCGSRTPSSTGSTCVWCLSC